MWGHRRWRRAFLAGLALTLIGGMTGPARWVVSPLGEALLVVAWIQGCDMARATLDLPIRTLSPAPRDAPGQIQLIQVCRPSRIRKATLVLATVSLYAIAAVGHRPLARAAALLAFLGCVGLFASSFAGRHTIVVDYAGDRFSCLRTGPIEAAMVELTGRGYVLVDAIPEAFRVVAVPVRGRNGSEIKRIRLLESNRLPCLGLAPARPKIMLRTGLNTIGFPVLLTILPGIILGYVSARVW